MGGNWGNVPFKSSWISRLLGLEMKNSMPALTETILSSASGPRNNGTNKEKH